MQTISRLLVLVFLCTSTSVLIASTDPFNNTDDFLQELEVFIDASKNATVQTAFKEFKQNFNSNTYQSTAQESIIATLDKMLEHQMAASPYFETYFNSLDALTKKEAANKEESIKGWHQCLTGILENASKGKFKPYQKYLNFSLHFFEKNTLQYSKSGTNWVADNSAYQLVFEDKQPKVKFEELNLSANLKDKSITIESTKGDFLPMQLMWEGKGGKVTWDRHELEGVFCTFSDYRIDTKKGFFKAEKTTMHHGQVLGNQVIEGSFEDKLLMNNTSNYPKFDSYDKNIKLDEIAKGIHYEGGISVYGTKIYGKGDEDDYAVVELYNDQKQLIMRGIGETFIINEQERISGKDIRTTVYFDQDSVFHPMVNVKYTFANQELNIFRGDKAKGQSPFYSSYHQMSFDTDNVDWVVTTDSILIGRKLDGFVGTNKRVSFQSLGYFDEAEYLRLQNGADRHPLATLYRLAHELGTDQIPAQEYATSLKEGFNLDNILSMLVDLTKKDFISYDKKTKLITVKEKVGHYVKAYHKKNDYDDMKITSSAKETHAVIHIGQKNMLTNGIKNLEISEQQQVAIKPKGGQLIIGENRDMEFDGKVFAGYSSIIGKDYYFDYEKNTIQVDSVRYFDLFLPEAEGSKNALSLASRIEHTQGVVLIDAPSNKSGKEDLEGFPAFKSKDNSYIFYDKKETQKGVYNRDSFYFQLNPFYLDNLDKLQNEDMQFEGKLISFDIFPDFEETVKLREDASLGFVHTTTAQAYPIYQQKGNFKGDINLSNSGLLGNGTVTYRWASFQSEDIVFRPKQMTGSARQFDLTEDKTAEIPQVFGEDILINWKPYRDSLYIKSKTDDFALFKANEHKLGGKMILTPDGLKGKGIFKWSQGILKSKLFSFGSFSTQSDTTNVSIKAFKTDALAFDTKNVSADIDFEAQKGVFKANNKDSHTIMPYNSYQTNLGDFIWDMKAETITFTGDKKGIFTSVHPDQDSLSFEGQTAMYDMKSSYLKIGGITHIQSADALIYAKDGKVTIKPGGVMETLHNAKIIANATNKNHVINRATVTIKGKKEYTASGFYEYNVGTKKQEIAFDDIVGMPVGKGKRSEKKMVTKANGEVSAEENFFIDEKIKFQGTISLDAESKNLDFNGFARLDTPHLPQADWFTIQSESAKENLVIAYKEPKNPAGELIGTGLYLSRNSMDIYPATMNILHTRKDRAILPIEGVFRYDATQDAFLFGDSLKVCVGTKKGNLWTLSNKDGMVKGEGSFDIGPKLEALNVKAAGEITTKMQKDTASTEKMTFDLLAGINMPIPTKLLAIMQADISAGFDDSAIHYTQPQKYVKAIAEFVSNEVEVKNAIATMLSYRDLKIPAEDNKFNFLFSELPMQWNPDLQSMISTNEKIGLVAINGQNIGKKLTSYLEIKMPSDNDDRVHLYLKSPNGYYYFYSYKQGVLSITSDNIQFKEALQNLKKKELLVKINADESYEIQEVDAGSAQRFVQRIKTANADEE